jgi:hypothetical protein
MTVNIETEQQRHMMALIAAARALMASGPPPGIFELMTELRSALCGDPARIEYAAAMVELNEVGQ